VNACIEFGNDSMNTHCQNVSFMTRTFCDYVLIESCSHMSLIIYL
jgi:hypothetical protein